MLYIYITNEKRKHIKQIKKNQIKSNLRNDVLRIDGLRPSFYRGRDARHKGKMKI
jgi:hypothetical protein